MRNFWSSRLSDVVVGFLLFGQSALAQPGNQPAAKTGGDNPPPEKYMFPILPGQRARLTGTMGELRSTHFHAGLDIDTETVGYAVRCANDGYVSRATVTTGGYGNVMYVKHPDGKTTLYAHLDEFKGAVGEFVREERYRRRQSEIDLYFQPGQFPVSRGETIALSGNTGGSGGPHLHFELRSEKDEALNPMTLGYEEIVDNLGPTVQKLALRTMDIGSRINDQFGRFEFHVQKTGEHYALTQPILANGRVGIEILAIDRQEGSRYKFGIRLIEVFASGEKVFSQHIEHITFSESRSILALMDFKVLETRGVRFNKLYIDDGNNLPYYSGSVYTKGIPVKDEAVPVEIRLTDFHDNTTLVNLTLKPSPVVDDSPFIESARTPLSAELHENILSLSVNHCVMASNDSTGQGVILYSKGSAQRLSPAYSGRSRSVFLVNLRQTVPDSVVTCNGTWVSNIRDVVPVQTDYEFVSDDINVTFPKRALYDTLYLSTSYDSAKYELFTVSSNTVPMHVPARLSIKPKRDYLVTRNLGVYRREGNSLTWLQSNWKNGWVNFSSLSLGQFTLLQDTIPPSIKPIALNGVVARLRIRDDLSGISYFEANIDGQWLLMNYDYKSGILHSERRDRSVPLKGEFELKVVDHAGNESIYRQRIN